MGYKTIKKQAASEYEEKKSVFIGAVERVENEEEARRFIDFVRSKHREARHNVYAYVIGSKCDIQRYSDDGEPQGTGGIPILEVIKRNSLSDTVVVVSRYFGGVLLGAAGLCRAYSKAASMAVKEAGTIEKVPAVLLKIRFDYEMLGKIEYNCSKNKWQVEDTEYGEKVELSLLFEKAIIEEIKTSITELSNNKFELISEKDGLYFKDEEGRLSLI